MIVDQSAGLHKGVADGGADKLKTALFSAPWKGVGSRCGGGDLRQRGGMGNLWLIVDERPDKVGKRFAALFHGQEGAGVANNGLNFPTMANNSGVTGAGVQYRSHSWRQRGPDRTDERPGGNFPLFSTVIHDRPACWPSRQIISNSLRASLCATPTRYHGTEYKAGLAYPTATLHVSLPLAIKLTRSP